MKQEIKYGLDTGMG